MIQRKQSLYLFLVTILCALPLIFPLASFTLEVPMEASSVGSSDGGVYTVWGLAFQNGEPATTYYHGILAILATLLPAITIFLYKNREFQMRLCIVEGIFVLGLVGFEIIGYYKLVSALAMSPYVVDFSYVAVAPLLAIFFVVMAYKGVLKDIVLLRNADRIR